jgi:hypothetical protein
MSRDLVIRATAHGLVLADTTPPTIIGSRSDSGLIRLPAPMPLTGRGDLAVAIRACVEQMRVRVVPAQLDLFDGREAQR